MIHLYVKQHNETGLKYFGRTYQNPFKYRGSGYRWREHLRRHGNNITTLSVWSYHDADIDQCKEYALRFSKEHDICNSVQWANMIVENVSDGHHKGHIPIEAIIRSANLRRGSKRSPEICKRISEGLRGKPRSEETKAKLRAANLGKKASEETKAKMRLARTTSRLGFKHTEETKAKISAIKKALHLIK